MTRNRARITLLVIAALWLISAWLLYDRYPTAADCDDVAAIYLQRGLFDAMTAAQYSASCRDAQDREARQQIVDRMNDEASFASSGR